MRNEEKVKRDLKLTFEFIQQAIQDPTLLDNLPDNSVIEFIESDRPIVENDLIKQADKYIKVNHHFEVIDNKSAPKQGSM